MYRDAAKSAISFLSFLLLFVFLERYEGERSPAQLLFQRLQKTSQKKTPSHVLIWKIGQQINRFLSIALMRALDRTRNISLPKIAKNQAGSLMELRHELCKIERKWKYL